MPSDITIFLGNISFLLDSLSKETPEALQEYDGILFPTYKVIFPSSSSTFLTSLS
jgi:hypothetical protein